MLSIIQKRKLDMIKYSHHCTHTYTHDLAITRWAFPQNFIATFCRFSQNTENNKKARKIINII